MWKQEGACCVIVYFTENITCVYSSGCGEYYLVNYFGKK